MNEEKNAENTPEDFDPESPRLSKSTAHYLVSTLRHHGNYTLGTLLTAVEAALGDGAQSNALKAIVRREMFLLMDRNQGDVYVLSGEQKAGIAPREMWLDEEQAKHLQAQEN